MSCSADRRPYSAITTASGAGRPQPEWVAVVLWIFRQPAKLGSVGGAAGAPSMAASRNRTANRFTLLFYGGWIGTASQARARPAEGADVAVQALVEALRQALAVSGGAQQAVVGAVADKGDLGQHRRHTRADQHHKRRALHPAVL